MRPANLQRRRPQHPTPCLCSEQRESAKKENTVTVFCREQRCVVQPSRLTSGLRVQNPEKTNTSLILLKNDIDGNYAFHFWLIPAPFCKIAVGSHPQVPLIGYFCFERRQMWPNHSSLLHCCYINMKFQSQLADRGEELPQMARQPSHGDLSPLSSAPTWALLCPQFDSRPLSKSQTPSLESHAVLRALERMVAMMRKFLTICKHRAACICRWRQIVRGGSYIRLKLSQTCNLTTSQIYNVLFLRQKITNKGRRQKSYFFREKSQKRGKGVPKLPQCILKSLFSA